MKQFCVLTCAALLAASSCTNEINEEGFVDKTNTISFSAYANKTRVYTSGDVTIAEMKEGSFGVVGYDNADNEIYLGSANKAIEQVWDESQTGGGSWEYANAGEMKYWPKGDAMDFVAYFPYSPNGAAFAATKNDTDPVMTITNETGNQDVLFSYLAGKTQDSRVHLYFNHALSKLASVIIQVNLPQTEVEVSKVEVLNTSTKGKIKVYTSGNASYEATNNDQIRSFDLSASPKTITMNDAAGVKLFDNDANGYLFATNAAVKHYVTGTGKRMWDGIKGNITGAEGLLSKSDLICLRLTCKVKAAGEYLVGDANNYAEMYIPMTGTIGEELDTITELLAGKRYTYKIIMSSNVGYKDNGDPIRLAPIRFSVYEVSDWNDVTVTVKL